MKDAIYRNFMKASADLKSLVKCLIQNRNMLSASLDGSCRISVMLYDAIVINRLRGSMRVWWQLDEVYRCLRAQDPGQLCRGISMVLFTSGLPLLQPSLPELLETTAGAHSGTCVMHLCLHENAFPVW